VKTTTTATATVPATLVFSVYPVVATSFFLVATGGYSPGFRSVFAERSANGRFIAAKRTDGARSLFYLDSGSRLFVLDSGGVRRYAHSRIDDSSFTFDIDDPIRAAIPYLECRVAVDAPPRSGEAKLLDVSPADKSEDPNSGIDVRSSTVRPKAEIKLYARSNQERARAGQQSTGSCNQKGHCDARFAL
jgi:hypothetical protein